MKKLDELFEEYEDVFVAREEEIKHFLLKYKKNDFIKRDVIDIKRIDATERLKTSGFNENLSMWQNFYKNVIVSTCVNLGLDEKRYDYKFYFTEEKIDSELLEKVEDIIKDANKLKQRHKFDQAQEKIDIVEDLVKEKNDKYFNEQLRILRQEIKEAEEEYHRKIREIEDLEKEIKNDREKQNIDGALKKSKRIVEIAKSIRKKAIENQYKEGIKELEEEKIERNITEIERKVEENRSSGRFNVAIQHCKDIIKLAESIDSKNVKKRYLKKIEEIQEEFKQEQEKIELDKKIDTLEKEFKDKKKKKNYQEALEIALELIQLSNSIDDKALWDKYTQQKNDIILKLEEQHKHKQQEKIEDKIKQLEKSVEKSQEENNLKEIIKIANEIIKLSTSIERDDITNKYRDLIEDTENLIKKKLENEKILEEIEDLKAELSKNREKKRWQKAILNCEDIITLGEKIENEKIVNKYSKINEEIKKQIEKENKGSLVSKIYDFNWDFETTGAVLTCCTLETRKKIYLIYGGHEKKLFLLDENANVLSSIEFDGWVRYAYPIDFDQDGNEELLVGTGDGNMLVLKLDEKKEELFGIFHQKSQGKILCCAAGDLNRNGTINFIFGGERKKVFIFEGLQSNKPRYILYYASWVTSCAVGPLKLPDLEKSHNFLLVGTQDGILQLVHVKDNDLEILWQNDLKTKINDIKVADITNNGYNEIIIACDDSKLRILDSSGEKMKSIKTKEGRPLTLCVDDIDDDGAQELIIGGSHGKLSIYQNEELDSLNIKFKWKTKEKTSIQSIITLYNKNEGAKQIIYGGYDRKIQSITDFDWGRREKLEIASKIKLPKIKHKGEKEFGRIQTNLRDQIIELLRSRYYLSLDALKKELINFGYSEDEIEKEIADLKKNDLLINQKSNLSIWKLNKEISIEDAKNQPSSNNTKELSPEQKSDVGTKVSDESNAKAEGDEDTKAVAEHLKDAIKSHLKENKIIKTKSELVRNIVELGFKKDKVKEEINTLNDQDIITYSRAKPKGWRLKS
jgi:hypothetical protein